MQKKQKKKCAALEGIEMKPQGGIFEDTGDESDTGMEGQF